MGILCSESERGWAQLEMEVIKAPSVQFNLFRKTYFLLQVLTYIDISNWHWNQRKSSALMSILVEFDTSSPRCSFGHFNSNRYQSLHKRNVPIIIVWFKRRNWWPTPVLSRAWKCNWKGGITRLHASGRQSIQSTHLTSNGQRTSVCLSLI